ncbi:MAG TPA: ROK family protein [Verrucomicrobiae bacterium]
MFLGIEIGGTKLQLALGDGSATLFEKRKLAVDAALGAEGIRRQIERTLPELLRGRVVAGAGLGFGGPVDWRAGKIACSHQIEGWSGFDLGGWLKGQIGVPVSVDNDANLGALGEATHGAGVGHDPVFYVTLGSGVGGGLVWGGRIYHGAAPGESELGHVRLDRGGATVESRCSGWAVDARIRALNARAPQTAMAALCRRDPGGEARHLNAALAQGDASARQLLEEVAADLAFGLSHVTHLVHPQLIVLGGGLSGVGEPLRAAVEASLRGGIMEVFQPGPKIALARLGEDAVPVGALFLASKAHPIA